MAEGGTLRLAVWGPELDRRGPGVLFRDIRSGKDAQVEASLAQIGALAPDILLLIGFDWDGQGQAARALQARLTGLGAEYPYLVHERPNSGLPTGLDMDGNGALSEGRDAQGYGRFTGSGGLLLLSKRPVRHLRDLSGLLWRDLPDNLLAGAELSEAARAVQRLSSTAHWDLEIDGLRLLLWSATPPIFDGPEDRNGRRNHDETALWLRELDAIPAGQPVVVMGRANLDPAQKEGRHAALLRLLSHPRLQDPQGPPTAELAGKSLRLDYILPDRALQVTGEGIVEPAMSRYKMVWVDIAWPCDCIRGD